jgi:peptidyl-prolyl cis-trans isomerase B (cyclophilin B)
MQRKPRTGRTASTRSTRAGSTVWVLVTFATVLVLVGGASAAVLLGRHGSDGPKMSGAAPTPAATRSAGPGEADGFDPSAGTGRKAEAGPSRTAGPTVNAQCGYLPASDGSGGKRPAATPAAHPTLAVHSHAVLTTNFGVIEADLAAAAAPCTVNSFLTLASSGFFTRTQCHRLTTDGLYVLQCGDPSGTGQGGPGYRFGDENLPTTSRPAYPRGTLAMANAGPGTNGSQFFLVYKDSEIDPNYSVFGRITAGIDVLDKIAAAGTDDSNGPGDGHPKLEVTINRVG